MVEICKSAREYGTDQLESVYGNADGTMLNSFKAYAIDFQENAAATKHSYKHGRDKICLTPSAQNFSFDRSLLLYREQEFSNLSRNAVKIGGRSVRYMKEFFISYNKADKRWAEWIAWKLEAAGYDVVIQAWDFRPGENFVLRMQDALKNSKKLILVLSEDYLNSSFTASEWSSVFTTDPATKERKLIPLRVRECKPEGLLGSLVYLDLINLSEPDAEAALLGAFAERDKPSSAPAFPGGSDLSTTASFRFPGNSQAGNRIEIALNRAPGVEFPSQKVPVSIFERIRINTELNAITPSQFNMLLFALSPPPGLIPPMPSPQADRSTALLAWAATPLGIGLQAVEEVLQLIVNPR